MDELDEDDRTSVEFFVETLNEHGRAAAEYLKHLLDKEENEEAAAWITVEL